MHIRHLVKAGPSSHTVSLPNEWVKKHQLKKGDPVYVHEQEHTIVLTLSPFAEKQQEKKNITIPIDSKHIDTIRRQVTSAYVNNYDTIILAGKSLPAKTQELREILHDFVALEITEQTSERITAKDLLNPSEISAEKTIKRIDMTVRSMLIDLMEGKELTESIVERDRDVNRLYFLLYRLVNQSLQGQGELKPNQALTLWNIVTNLEGAADDLKTLVQHSKDKGLLTLLKTLNSAYQEALEAYYKKDKQKAEEIALKRQELNKQAGELKPGSAEICKSLLSRIIGIARITIDEES